MLNEFQQRSLCIALRLVDQHMRKVEAILERPQEIGVMYEIQNDLTPAMLGQLPEKIVAVRAVLQDLRDRFDLSLEIILASREGFKSLPILWEILMESSSARLRRYGAVDDRVGPMLDPDLKKLEKLLMEMEEILFVPRRREASAAGDRSSSGKGRAK